MEEKESNGGKHKLTCKKIEQGNSKKAKKSIKLNQNGKNKETPIVQQGAAQKHLLIQQLQKKKRKKVKKNMLTMPRKQRTLSKLSIEEKEYLET